jgi:hypothetical protein
MVGEVDQNLAKIGVEGSNPFAPPNLLKEINVLERPFGPLLLPRPGLGNRGSMGEAAGAML